MFNFNLSNITDLLAAAGITNGFNAGVVTTTATNTNQVTRYARANEILLIADGLCPDKTANVFFDQTLINDYCQVGNRLNLHPSNNAGVFESNEGIVNLTTNAYARIIGTSNNIVYLNQNYITVNIAPYYANTLSSSDYAKDDIVFQSSGAGGAVFFQGKVEYYDSAAQKLVIAPTFGDMITVPTSPSRVIRKANSNLLVNATMIMWGDLFPVGSTIRSVSNVARTGLVQSMDHTSGTVTIQQSTGILNVPGNANAAVGQVLTIVSGTGFGQSRTVSGVTSNNQLSFSTPLPTLTANSRYTIGPRVVDEFGKLCGIFNLPETESVKFPAGDRVITITDAAKPSNTEYLMKASSLYKVTGAPVVVIPPPPPPPRRFDPVAQTFFTPEALQIVNGVSVSTYGIYVSSVDVCFSAKPILADLQLPVSVQIVTVQNGLPTRTILATAVKQCRDVNIATVPSFTNATTYTKFTFDDPVFLAASTEYAIIVTSNSPDYSVFISELGGEILGSSPVRRVSEQPYIGSFFKSQNASTWTPIQNQDLMFRINKCVFPVNQTGAVYFKPLNQTANVNMDSILVHTVEENHKPTSTQYKFRSTNAIGTQDPVYTYIPLNTQYGFGADLLTSTKTSNRRRTVYGATSTSLDVGVEMTTTDADMSPLIDYERMGVVGFASEINNGSIANTDISIINYGNHANSSNIRIAISAPDDPAGVTANAYVAALSGNSISTIIVDNAGSGYYTTPTITFTEAAATTNATAIIAGETSAIGGNNKARYVTKQITLADGFDAGDIRVYLDLVRPQGTNVNVYYKVKSASDTDSFTSKNWKLMQKVTDKYSVDQNQVIELEYRPSLDVNRISYVENGITYPIGGTFKYFAIKIVMMAEDTTVTPIVRNFRAIATPAG